jgi:hypothetical protein
MKNDQQKPRRVAKAATPRRMRMLAETPRKKNFRLRQSKIDEAMKVLGTKTETETIEQALDLVVFRQSLVEGVRAMKGAGLVNLFDDEQ